MQSVAIYKNVKLLRDIEDTICSYIQEHKTLMGKVLFVSSSVMNFPFHTHSFIHILLSWYQRSFYLNTLESLLYRKKISNIDKNNKKRLNSFSVV